MAAAAADAGDKKKHKGKEGVRVQQQVPVTAEDVAASRALEFLLEHELLPSGQAGGGGAASALSSAAASAAMALVAEAGGGGGGSSGGGSGGVLSSVWNQRGTVRSFQNLLEGWLGYAEAWKNLLNWTHPKKVGLGAGHGV
jgi:hypothetical protein